MLVKTPKKWFDEITYLRAIAIIGVLIIHTTDDTISVKNLNELTFSLIYIEELFRFAVPMFIFVSGFVMYNKYKYRFSIKNYYKKRFISILVPYLIFSLIYCIINKQLGLFPIFTLNSVKDAIFHFNANGHFWYIKLILTFYVFYPAIITYYEVTKNYFTNYILFAFSLSIIIMYLIGSFIPSLNFLLQNPFKYLIYFLFGIYTNDYYEKISQVLKKISTKKIIVLSILIIILPLFSMFQVVNSRYDTQFLSFIPYYLQIVLLSTHILHMCIFIFCLYILILYKPRFSIFKKIGEYSFGIFLVHAIYHNIIIISIFSRYLIYPVNLNYYIILFLLMLTFSYFTVKIMLKNRFASYIITGKLTTK